MAGLVAQFRSSSNVTAQYDLVRKMKDLNDPSFNNFFLEIAEGAYHYNVKRMALLGLELNSGGPNLVLADRVSRVLVQEKEALLVEAELNLMAVIGSAKHTGLVMPFMGSGDIYIREAAVKALAVFGDRSCVEGAKRLLESETGDTYHAKTVRKYAMLILQKYSDNEAVPALEATLVRSLNNATNQDESLYAVSAIRSVDTNTARQVLEKNADLITNVAVKASLYEAVALPVPAEPAVVEQPAVEPPAALPAVEARTEGFLPVAPAREPTKYDFDPSSVQGRYASTDEALRQLTLLSNLAAEMEGLLAASTLEKRYYSRLADVYFKMAEIHAGLRNGLRSRGYYRDASAAYQKAR
jgi:hypothetical protein